MKKLLLLLLIILPLLTFSQNKITLKSGESFVAKVEGVFGPRLVFKENVPAIDGYRLELSEVVSVAGEMPGFRKKAILKKNPNVKFIEGEFSEEDMREVVKQKPSDDIYFNQNKQSAASIKTAGYHLELAGKRYLTGVGLVFAGGALYTLGVSEDQDELSVIGGILALTGGIVSLTGHVELIKAGRKLNSDAVTLSGSSTGLGLAISF